MQFIYGGLKVYVIISSLIGSCVLGILLAGLISEIVNRLKWKFNKKHREKKEEDIDNLIKDEVPFFISRVYFHTVHKGLSKIEKVLSILFPIGYMNHHNRIISNLFHGGYCWHFAHMLQESFGRGTVCWGAPHSHFVWQDVDGKCWDIYGRSREAEYSFYIPESYLPKDIIFVYQQTNYKGHDIDVIPVERYMEIVDNYAEDNNLTYNRDFVSNMIQEYILGKNTKNRQDIKEKTAVVYNS